MGCKKLLLLLLSSLLAVILSILYLPSNNLLLDINPVSFKIPLYEKFEERLKVNSHLENAKLLFKNEVSGPESLALGPDGDLYTGTQDGFIYRISNDKLSVFVKLEGDRPLGIRYHRNGYLYVMSISALYQIFMNKTIVKMFGIEDMKFSGSNEKSSQFIDDLVVIEGSGSKGGDVIYFSDVSTKFSVKYFVYSYLEPDSTGRVIKYDINAKTFTIIMKDLYFPNGIEVNDEKNALLVCEFTKRRILKHFIKGPNKGITQIITSQLPAEPDNIRRSLSSDETYWIGLAFARNASNSLIGDRLSEYPVIRKLLLRTTYLLGSILSSVGRFVNLNPLSEVGDHMVSGFILLPNFQELPGMVIEIDSKGTIVRTLQSPNHKFKSASEVREVQNLNNKRVLYIGSAFNPYIGKLILNT